MTIEKTFSKKMKNQKKNDSCVHDIEALLVLTQTSPVSEADVLFGFIAVFYKDC